MNFVENSLWFKVLSDSQIEYGIDGDIITGRASWTRGRKDIIAVGCLFEDYNQGFMVLCPPIRNGNFTSVKQLDQMVFSMKEGEGERIKRTFEIDTTGYKKLYRYEDFYFKVDLDFIKQKRRGIVRSRTMCYQLTSGENQVGEEVQTEYVLESDKVSFSICNNGDFIIDPT